MISQQKLALDALILLNTSRVDYYKMNIFTDMRSHIICIVARRPISLAAQ
jgi:hypothetical protein